MIFERLASIKNRNFFFIILVAPFLAFAFVFFSGAGLDVLNIDEAQYAEISREMALSSNWLKVYELGHDYLDKPPLLFWVSALIFKLFGVSSFVYRLAPILLSFFGVYSLWRFVSIFYNRRAAYFSALIWVSTFALDAMNRDVRTDNLLTTFVIFSIWQLSAYLKAGHIKYLIGGSVGIGLSMLAKGPIGLIVPILAFSGQFISSRTYRLFFKPAWLFAIVIIGVLLMPMCIGLYQQYGGRGLYFYFWLQSFGRITGQNEWNNHAPLTFQATNFLWSFQPWVFPFVFALMALSGRKIVSLIAQFRLLKKTNATVSIDEKLNAINDPPVANFKMNENIALSGFFLTFIALSTSHYQLPHYTFVVFPLAAVITGVYFDYLSRLIKPFFSVQALAVVQGAICICAFLSITFLLVKCFPDFSPTTIVFFVFSFSLVVFFISNIFRNRYNQEDKTYALFAGSFTSMFAIALLLNVSLFPKIYAYQADALLGVMIRKDPKFPLNRLFITSTMHGGNKELDFYALCFNAGYVFPIYKRLDDVIKNLKTGDNWTYTDREGLKNLAEKGYKILYLKRMERFHVSMLTKQFILTSMRANSLQDVYLVKFIVP